MTTLTLAQIKERLPHREPILLVDRVLDYVVDTTLVAERAFAQNDPLFEGHFPGHPVLPGMLAVESLAQAAGILVCVSREVFAKDILFYFMGVSEVKFKLPIRPGMVLRLEVSQVNRKGDVYKFDGVGKVDGKTAVEATFMAKMIRKETI